jgi:hypothetical protein
MVQYGGSIIAAFLVTGMVLAGMIVTTFINYGVQLRSLRRLALDRSDRPNRS